MAPAATGYAPNLEKYLKSLKGQHLELTIENLVSLLKRRQITGAEDCAVATAHCLLQVVAKSKWQDVDTLIYNVSRTGNKLARALPHELVISNVARRVLGLIRDEAAETRNEHPSETPSEGQMTPSEAPTNATALSQQWPPATGSNGPKPPFRPGMMRPGTSVGPGVPRTLSHLLSASPSMEGDGHLSPAGTSGTSTPLQRSGASSSQVHALKSEVIDGIEEIMDEISQVDDQIGALADVHIRPGDHILVHQPSRTVSRFILRAALKRKFTVLIASQPPPRVKRGEEDPYASFRKKLSSAGVSVINITCGGVIAYMSLVNKVIMGASAVVAGGGVISDAGAAAIARAAKEYGIPIVVLAGIYKFSPSNPFRDDDVVQWANPMTYVSFAEGQLVSTNGCLVKTAVTEVISAQLIDTYVTNLGTHSRAHLSGLIADHYKPEDMDLHLWEMNDP